jgi:transposase
MKIMSLDLGQSKTAVCMLHTHDNRATHLTRPTTRQAMHDLLAEHAPDRVVMEIGPTAGWVCDLARVMDIEVQVANPNHEAWRWRATKHKSDRIDALKLARLSAMEQLPTVHVPDPSTRAYRQLIRYRQTLVGRTTAVKNSIRAILTREGLKLPAGKNGWSRRCRQELSAMACVEDGAVWRMMLTVELDQLAHVEEATAQVERQLEEQARHEPGVALLRTIPGVGPRLAETIVAIIDDPHRFRRGRQVASYAGLAPRRYQSGAMDRQGRISGQGDRLLRALLVEVAWLGRRHNPWMCAVYERTLRGSPSRKKIAIVAVARRLLIRCWAMLRDGTPWRPPMALHLAA